MPSDLVFDLSSTQSKFIMSDAQIVQLFGPMGEGKCLKRGTGVLMYNGRIKAVEDIKIGDRLMGDDSTPRKVLALGHGRGPMYKVVPFRGESFTVNGDHILCLKRTRMYRVCRKREGVLKPYNDRLAGKIIHISVDEYLKQSNNFKSLHKLYRSPVSFRYKKTDLDPYWLGIWLGDGHSSKPGITTPDEEIVQYLYEFAAEYKVGIRIDELKDNQSNSYVYSNGNRGGTPNPVTELLRKYNLLNNKHIPYEYKVNSRDIRLRLLAGLADSDGYVNRNSYQFTLKSKQLADDICFLARSLGFAAYCNKVQKTIKPLDFTGEYFQVGISGDLSCVPVILERKKCRTRAGEPFKSVLVTGIKEIITEDEDEYFGFVIDGNHRFLLGDFTVSHNTFAGVAGLIAHAQRCGRDIRTALVRDTFQNIKTSTIPDIREYLGSWVRFSDGSKKMTIMSTPRVECDLFGIDDEASISKLQGPQYALIWLEEPAPIYEKANAGLPREVFDMAVARSARQRGTIMRVQITQNPADSEHWTSILEDEPDEYAVYEDPDSGEIVKIIKKTFHIPKGENKFLSLMTRAANLAAFQHDEAKKARYIEGETATVHLGKRVTPGYVPGIHYAKNILPVLPGELMTFWDSYQHPCCVTAQYAPSGQLIIHDCLYAEGLGPEELIEEKIDPLLLSPKYKGKIQSFRVIGDFSMATADQSSVRSVTSKKLEKRFKTSFEPGPTRWSIMKNTLNPAFRRLLNEGRPAVTLSRSAVILHRALNGGWHYKTDNNGHIIGDKPVKNQHSHPGDAFANGIAVLMPFNPREKLKKVVNEERRRRANSYRGGNYSRKAATA